VPAAPANRQKPQADYIVARVLENRESGTMLKQPTTWSIVGTGDFNGDGMSDILWRDTSGNVAVWFMNGAQVTSSTFVGNAPITWSDPNHQRRLRRQRKRR
jgi:FG-GAP repeat